MTSELSILALYGLLVLATMLVQVMLALPQLGLPYLASPRDEGRTTDGVAARAERALTNSVIAMALFAPAVLLLNSKAGLGGASLIACQIFLVARVVYLGVYLAGIPWARTGAWLAGFAMTGWLYLMAL